MKQGWQIKKLGEVCDIINGRNQKAVECADGQYPIYGSGGSIMGYASDYLCESGTTIIGRKGSINNPIYIDTPFWNVDTAFGISSKPMMSSKYVYYFCKSFDFSKLNKGTTLPSLVKKDLMLIDIPVPPLSEQQRIVSLLDAEFAKIDTLKANAERNLQNAKDLFQAALKKELEPKEEGWVKVSLYSVCSKIGSGATPLGGKSTYGKEGISLIRSLNVHNNEFHYEDLAHINEEQAQQLSNVEVHEEDVLFNITGASVTRCCKVPKDVIPARVNQHVSILRLTPNTILPSLLVYTLISPNHNTALMKMAENGATRQAITKKQLEDWVIDYPTSITEQQSIVSNLDEINAKSKSLQANYEKTIALCDDLKQALLRKAFKGEL